jgi:hypothetical protein
MKTVAALLLLLALTAHLQGARTHDAAQHPVIDAQTEQEIMAVLDAFMTAFNARDAAAEERTYHFPHYRLASGQMRVLDAPGAKTQATMKDTYRRFVESGWDHSSWTRRRIIHIAADKAHVDTQFTRYRKDGTVIAAFDSLYVVIKEKGRWGIKLRSSFAQ